MPEEFGTELVGKARQIALTALEGTTRGSGAPFIEHPDNVAAIVRDEIGLGNECIAAVYLHEATRFHPEVSLQGFPKEITSLVDGLNKIATIRPKDTRLEAEKYKKLIVQYSSDPRITVIKIADRLEIMRNLSHFSRNDREQKLLETLMLYLPLAHQLGLHNIKSELEDCYFRYADPVQYRAITNRLKATEKDRERLSRDFIEPLKKKLSDAGIEYKLKIRTKTAYSIFRKMQAQKVDFDGVYDIFAIRFIIECEPDHELEKDLCWKVYSYVTEEYETVVDRLRDWLTNPKPNGYESLHVTVKDAHGRFLEVQIRTVRMDETAESGLASHWSYKGIKHNQTLDTWLNSVRYNLEHKFEANPEDMPRPPKEEIFVFTPTGELRILPAGSSVLDFAYNIHTGLGSRCTGAIVGGKAVPIKHKLQTGDVVEIMSGKNQRPNSDWLGWVVTSKARSRIKIELNEEERKKSREGREILGRRLKNWKMEFPDEMLTDYMHRHGYTSVLTFYADIADEKIDANDIKAFITEYENRSFTAGNVEEKSRKEFNVSGEDILVINARNVKGLDYRMARCCNPVFGDDVFGFVTRTEGIKIHRMSCPNAARLLDRYPYRIQKVVWQDTSSSGDFVATVRVVAHRENSVLSLITDTVNSFKVSLNSMNVKENAANGSYEITIRLLVPSNTELDKVLSKLERSPQVLKVRRV